MKYTCYLIPLLIGTLLCSVAFAQDQLANRPRSGSSNQWMSHQMFQPPPEPHRKGEVSPDPLEEIKQLYVLAKKEHDAKVLKGPASPAAPDPVENPPGR